MGKDILEKVEELAKLEYDKLKCWAHAWPHIKRVKNCTQELAKIVDADPVSCGIAAYCHDLGRVVEEKTIGKQTDLGNIDHSLDSIKPTVDLLKYLGIDDRRFNFIVGAVAVHSDKLYHGKNLIAKVLRDSDKKDALGPWGTLRHVKHHLYTDLVYTNDIMKYQDNFQEIKRLADETLRLIKDDKLKKERYLNVLDFFLEWVDNKMLDLNESYSFLERDYLYTKQSKEFLLS